MHVAPQQVVYNVCRAMLDHGVWTHYLEVFQEVVAEKEVLTFVHTSKNPGGMVNAGTVSLVKLDTPHYGPGPGLGRTKLAIARNPIAISATGTDWPREKANRDMILHSKCIRP